MSLSYYIRVHPYSSEPIESSNMILIHTVVASTLAVMQRSSHVSWLVGDVVPPFSSGGPPTARRCAVSIDFAAAAGS